jgi:hypothetical protein
VLVLSSVVSICGTTSCYTLVLEAELAKKC